MSDGGKQVTLTLTQRQWDHVLLAVEATAMRQEKIAMEGGNYGLEMAGAWSSVDRFQEICNEMGKQYLEQCPERKINLGPEETGVEVRIDDG